MENGGDTELPIIMHIVFCIGEYEKKNANKGNKSEIIIDEHTVSDAPKCDNPFLHKGIHTKHRNLSIAISSAKKLEADTEIMMMLPATLHNVECFQPITTYCTSLEVT